MKDSILHITNGDCTTNYLKKLSFSGSFITWREMLSEGKTSTDIGSESFWKTRFEFLKSSYKITKKQFIDYTLKEYRNLCNKKSNDEIVLWFEYDLFCQINMIAVISWLKRYRKGHHITLVNPGIIKGTKKMKGVAELTEKQLLEHYKNRIELTLDDIEYADYIWQLYCSNSPLRLKTAVTVNPDSPFKYLTNAIINHIKRFPSLKNGLNYEENLLLETIHSNKFKNKKELVSTLLKNDTIFGYGDVQFEKRIEDLKQLVKILNPVKLSNLGKKVLANEVNMYKDLRSEEVFLGGAKKYSFLYQENQNKLLQITNS